MDVVFGNTIRRGLVSIALGFATLPSAHADVTFTVTAVEDRIDDDTTDGVCHTSVGTCSLRAAIMQANHSVDPLVRIVLPAGVYVLSIPKGGVPFDGEDTGDLNITTPVDPGRRLLITGAGAVQTIIDANRIDRVLAIHEHANVVLTGLTLRNGLSPAGGGIMSINASLSLVECVVERSGADTGGGVRSDGDLTVVRSTLRSNLATHGAGIYFTGMGTGTATIRDSVVYGNGADDGGGIYVYTGTLYAINSTVSSNAANTNGGGIYSAGITYLFNVSVIGNDADHDRDENGGIGGGIYVASGNFSLENSLVAANTIVNAPIFDDCNGFVITFGWNLLGETGGCTFGGSGTASVGPVSLGTIGPLQDNGGPTLTHALLAGSEAIDSTFDSIGCRDANLVPLTSDQRGARRPAGLRCDVGAFESGAIADHLFGNGFDR